MSHISVTVLMAVYNGGDYLAMAVDSVLRQDYQGFELLIIDDCSTDGQIDKLAQRHDPRLRVYRNPTNIGQTASLHLGLQMAKGDVVARMDADDMAYPRWLSNGMSYLSAHPDIVIATCQAVVMDSESKVQKKLYCPMIMSQMLLRSLYSTPLNHVGCLMRKTIVLSHQGFDVAYPIAADFALWSRLLRAGYKFAMVEEVGVVIRSHRRSITAMNKGRADVEELCRILDDNIQHFCHLTLTKDQRYLWWIGAYTPELLDYAQIEELIDLITTIYNAFEIERYHISSDERHVFYQRLVRKVFIKASFGLANRAKYEEVIRLSQRMVHKFGWASFYGIWSLCTVQGRLIRIIQLAYGKYELLIGWMHRIKGEYGI